MGSLLKTLKTAKVPALLAFVCAAGLFGATGQRGASAATTGVVSITPGSQSAKIGDTVTVTVAATGMHEIALYEFRIQYDPKLLEYVDRTDLGFLDTTGRQADCPAPQVDAAAGTVQFGCGSISEGETPIGPSGDADLANVRFKAVGNGTSDLVFTKTELADWNSVDCCGSPPDVKEAAVAVGVTSAPPLPPTPVPDPVRRVQPTPVGATLPAYGTLPDTPDGGSTVVGAASLGGATPSGGASGADAGAPTGTVGGVGVSPTGDGSPAISLDRPDVQSGGARQGSSDFPVAGQGYRQDTGPGRAAELAYAMAAAGFALVIGGAGVKEVKRRRAG